MKESFFVKGKQRDIKRERDRDKYTERQREKETALKYKETQNLEDRAKSKVGV